MVIHSSNFRAVFHSAHLWHEKTARNFKVWIPSYRKHLFWKNYTCTMEPNQSQICFIHQNLCVFLLNKLFYRCSFFKMNVFYKRVFTLWNFARFFHVTDGLKWATHLHYQPQSEESWAVSSQEVKNRAKIWTVNNHLRKSFILIKLHLYIL